MENRRRLVLLILTLLVIVNLCSLLIHPCLAVEQVQQQQQQQQQAVEPVVVIVGEEADAGDNNNNNNPSSSSTLPVHTKDEDNQQPTTITSNTKKRKEQQQQPIKVNVKNKPKESPTTTTTPTTKTDQPTKLTTTTTTKVDQPIKPKEKEEEEKKPNIPVVVDTTKQEEEEEDIEKEKKNEQKATATTGTPSSSSSSSSTTENTGSSTTAATANSKPIRKKKQSKFEVVIGSITQRSHQQLSQHLPIAKTEYRDRFINNPKYEMMPMALANGSKYECYVPAVLEEYRNTWVPIPTAAEFAELLSPLDGHCMYKPTNGWWTYELCYNKGVRQLHYDKQKIVTEYNVGLAPESGEIKGLDASFIEQYNKYGEALQHMTNAQMEAFEPPTPRQVEAGQIPYYVEIYNDGTACEVLTGVKRQTEVRFYCNADNQQSYIFEIQEPSTCMYYLKIYTNLMCTHPLFRPRQDASMDIECFEAKK
ncbi:OS-9-related protein [Cavenderia fasciculata]|uniref:OS-9-related protein n=1 Tax=Cavenderia fasciculata TaxID=261658 RepID=F4Q0Z0_CACFS|nr:OS-9-related protein [Cavenderia fasciculata]EGG18491.1 OS-9-related protein [Cavenderia fasciculata]|eukprot:XP_004366395.1 OS-9-related protein [Cavenderia fasciculata]